MFFGQNATQWRWLAVLVSLQFAAARLSAQDFASQPAFASSPADALGQSMATDEETVIDFETPCCDDSWPRWYVTAESIFLWRDNSANDTRPKTTISQNAEAIEFKQGVGPQISLVFQNSTETAWEAKYFSLFDMTGNARSSMLESLFDYPSTPPSNDSLALLPVNRPYFLIRFHFNIEYQSELHNAEINYYRTWDQFSLLTGFRYVRLTENFSDYGQIESSSAATSGFYDRHTENNLFGGQLGLRWKRNYQRFSWEATGKAGVFGNDAQQSQAASFRNPDFNRPTRYRGDVAFVGDFNFSLTTRLTKIWSLRGGYTLMFIDGVALAPEQSLSFFNASVATNGSVFLNGFNVGLEGQW